MITVSTDCTTALYITALVTGTDSESEAREAAESAYHCDAIDSERDSFYDGFVITLERN